MSGYSYDDNNTFTRKMLNAIDRFTEERDQLRAEVERLRGEPKWTDKLNDCQYHGDDLESCAQYSGQVPCDVERLRGGAEPVAIEYQHEDTGQIGYVDAQQVEWGFFENNPRLQELGPIYRHPPAPVPDGWIRVMNDLANELESEVEGRRGGDLDRRIERDLLTVKEARALLSAAPKGDSHG